MRELSLHRRRLLFGLTGSESRAPKEAQARGGGRALEHWKDEPPPLKTTTRLSLGRD